MTIIIDSATVLLGKILKVSDYNNGLELLVRFFMLYNAKIHIMTHIISSNVQKH